MLVYCSMNNIFKEAQTYTILSYFAFTLDRSLVFSVSFSLFIHEINGKKEERSH